MQKSVYFINSFLRCSQVCDQSDQIHFDYNHPIIFQLTLNVYEFASTWKKSGYFIILF